MSNGHLEINKTPYLPPEACSSTIFPISVKGNSILPVAQAKNLGVILDFSFFHTSYTQSTSKTCLYLWNFPQTQPFLSVSTTTTLVWAIMLQLPNWSPCFASWHLIFHAAGGVILFKYHSDDATHLLKVLSWLPFPLRIKAKFLSLQRWMNK